MPDPKQSFLLMILAVAILAVAMGFPALYLRARLRPPMMLPRSSIWSVPWNGWAVLAAFLGIMILPTLIDMVLAEAGFFQMLYGPDFPSKMSADQRNDQVRQAAHLRGLWSQIFAIPLQIALIVLGFRYAFKTTLPQMGLARERVGPNLVVGYIGWLALAPLAFGIFMLAIVLLAPNPAKHPLMDLGHWAGRREWIVFAIQAVLFAPLLEEIIFRGLLLPWLLQPRTGEARDPNLILQPQHRSHFCYAVALFFSLQSPALMDALKTEQWEQVLAGLAPCIFLLLLLPFYLILPFNARMRKRLHFDNPQTVQALFANSVLFAAIHASVWPSPIPLFVLALGLGWMAIRTHSIIPSIVTHALFNSVAVVYLMLGGTA